MLQLASTLFMTGLIWFVQVVHYPLFQAVGEPEFLEYERRHATRTGWVVGFPMLAELATSLLLLLPRLRPAWFPGWCSYAGFALVFTIWISTAGLQMPLHRRLSRVADLSAMRQLVRSNWMRTVAWSLRSLLLLWVLGAHLRPS